MNSTEEQLDNTVSQIYEGDEASTSLFTIQLTQMQLKILQLKLPTNYILKPMSELNTSSKSKSKNSKQKVDTLQILNSSTNKLEDSLLNNTNINNTSQNQNRLHLREKKQKLSYDHKYPDLEAPISGMKFKTNNEGLKKCWKILQQIKKHAFASPFLEPVDPLQLNIPDYLDIIKEPMDLSTIEKKFKNNQYQTVQQFYNDIKKIWQNSWQYNQQGSEIYMMTTDISNHFQKLYREVDKTQQKDYHNHSNSSKKSYAKDNFAHSVAGIPTQYQMQFERFQRQVDSLSAELQQLRGNSGAKGKKTHKSQSSKGGGGGGYDKSLSTTEKRNLGASIRKLAPEYLKGVWEIVSSGTNLGDQSKEELEFDIDTLPVYKARELERYVKAKLLLSNKQKKKRGKNKNKNEISTIDNMEESQILGSQSISQFNPDNKNLMFDTQHSQKQIKSIHDNIKTEQFTKSSDSSFITDSDDSL